MIERIKSLGKTGSSFVKNSELGNYLESINSEGDAKLVVFFSNGYFDGVIDRFAKSLINS